MQNVVNKHLNDESGVARRLLSIDVVSAFLKIVAVVVLVLGTSAAALPADGTVRVAHLYNLANFTGVVPYSDVRIYADRAHDEVYVAESNNVRVFNGAGMEIFAFGYGPEYGAIRDLAVDESGDILLLSLNVLDTKDMPRVAIVRCDYRGEVKETSALSNLPPELSSFTPSRMVLRTDGLLLVGTGQLWAVETDRSGVFRKSYDLAKVIGAGEKDRGEVEIFGFTADDAGDMLFTVPVLFKAFVVAPDGTIRTFGKAGSAPGMFGVAAGIETDGKGDFFVADKLRSVVMVFDKDFNFVREFGGAATAPRT